MKKYYFVSYAYQLVRGWNFGHKIVNIHPLNWIFSMNHTCEDGDRYTLLSWQKLTEEEYKEYKDFV